MRHLYWGNVSGKDATKSLNGDPVPAHTLSRASAQITMTGSTTPSSTLKLQFSNDMPPKGLIAPAFTPTNWTDVANSSVTVNANSSFATPASDLGFAWIRWVYTYTSGTAGTYSVNASAQGWT